MNWTSILGVFAKPLGAVINKGLAMASAAFVDWAVAKGLPLDSATSLATIVVMGISTLISGFAATQGVQIPVINADDTNGVKVVSANSPSAVVNAPLTVAPAKA
jgi:hypothetical protein